MADLHDSCIVLTRCVAIVEPQARVINNTYMYMYKYNSQLGPGCDN